MTAFPVRSTMFPRPAPVPAMSTRSDQFLAAYARFAQAIALIPDPKAQELHRVALGVPRFVEEVKAREPRPTPSQVAAGLEQGLQEMPSLFDEVDVQWRWAVSRALHEALATECPEFTAHEAQRMQQTIRRGRIQTDAEFHQVRHRIDVLEGEPELGDELKHLYALVEAYGGAD
jgi:hypothetical protein